MAFLLYHNFIKYMPRTNEINNGMNNSSALVAPQRSEIRMLQSTRIHSFATNMLKPLRKVAFIATYLLVGMLSSCSALDVQLSRSLTTLLVILASMGVLYCFHILWNKFGGWTEIINHEENEK